MINNTALTVTVLSIDHLHIYFPSKLTLISPMEEEEDDSPFVLQFKNQIKWQTNLAAVA